MGKKREVSSPSSQIVTGEKCHRTGRQLALFGITSGTVWVAEDAFVTRMGDDFLVERWVNHRAATILVHADSSGTMRTIWETLNDIAGDQLPTELRHV